MALDPDIRASDAERDHVATTLREHCALGRITMDELQERLDAAYAARTVGELQDVTSDLPEADLYERPVPAVQQSSHAPVAKEKSRAPAGTTAGQMWGTWAVVSGINLTVWLILALAGTLVYPWWIWVAGPWGAILVLTTIFGSRRS
ncbi:DUF1707 domain-containing protein [Actinomadura viridis]|uniref:DUF1707 domain-containing protein n=1 Tax=Actinomadura viridis TaxID=58110 RepID=A0A931DCP8_9ACTN|nr:DUF1707 domain-containing protein [Actinomadura viridis]MBG6086439.1 hypothetical protein [Actinomadura viridis]